MAYEVKLDVYEGPFDLLLDLISKQKVDIYEIPIAEIAREYLSYLDRARELDLEVTSEFLLIAATLLSIKAAGLLEVEVEEEEEEELSPLEAKEVLIAKLLDYKQFKSAASSLAARLEAEGKYFRRDVELEERFVEISPDFLEGREPEELTRLFYRLLSQQTVSLVDSEHILSVPVSLDAKVEYVLDRLGSSGKLKFASLTSDLDGRVEVVVTFLALLELYKRGQVLLNQEETFGEIEICLGEVGKN